MQRGELAPEEGGKKRGRGEGGREVSGTEGVAARERGCGRTDLSCLGAMFLPRGSGRGRGGERKKTNKSRRWWRRRRRRRRRRWCCWWWWWCPPTSVKASTHSGGGRVRVKFFRGRSCNVPHRLATLALRRCLLCCCSFQFFPLPTLPRGHGSALSASKAQ